MQEKDNKHDMPGKRGPGGLGSGGMEPPASLLPDVLARLGLLHTLPAQYRQGLAQDSNSWQMRAQAIQALGESDQQTAFEHIVESLQDDHEAVRAAALRALGKRAQRTFVPVECFTNALKDSDSEVRATAAQMLGMLGEQAPLEHLLSALDDDKKTVRIAAIQALGNMGERTPIDRLVEVLSDDPAWPVRETAVLTLGTLGGRMPIEPLLRSLYDPYTSVRDTAAFVLAQRIRIETLIARVEHDLEYDKPPIREAAARALGELAKRVPQELLREPLISALKKDKHPSVRIAAVLALEQLESHPDIVRALIEASHDGDVGVRQTAKIVLESLQPGEADPETKNDVLVEAINAQKTTAPVRDRDYVGQQVGQYRLIRQLGLGSRATVYLGQHVLLETYAAIKVLKARLSDEDLQELSTKIRVIAQLQHPHIVRILDCIIAGENGVPCLVMDYAPNGTLRERHPKNTQVPLPTVVTYVKQLAEALEYIHEQGVIHQDVKPENMLLNSKDEVLLSDFSIATLVRPGRPHPYDNRIAGTPAYMAPERFNTGLKQTSDQYSLAVVVYEWLCGEPPFIGPSYSVIAQHQDTPPPPLRKKVPLPRDVETVVLRALAKDPRDRFESVKAFADALVQASSGVLALDRHRNNRIWPDLWTAIVSRCRAIVSLAAAIVGITLAALRAEVLLRKLTPTGFTSVHPHESHQAQVAVYTYKGHQTRVTVVAWSPQKLVASGDETGYVHIWDTSGKTRKVYRPHQARVTGISWFPDGRRIATTGKDSTLRIWDTLSGNDVLKPYPNSPIPSSMFTVAWLPEQGNPPTSEHLAVGSGSEVLIFDNPIQYGYTQPGYTYRGHTGTVYSVAWSPDPAKKIVASASADSTVQVWNVDTSKQLIVYTGHKGNVLAVAWSLDGKLIASGGRDQTVQVWDATTSVPSFVTSGLPGAVNALAWLPSKHGRYLVWATTDGPVEVWNVDKKERVSVYQGHNGSVNALTTSSDGLIASGGDDKTVQVWEHLV